MSKHRYWVVLFFVWLLPISGNAADNGEFGRNLLWQVKKADVTVGYILGTIHSEDARIDPMVAAILPYVRDSQGFALEINMDEQTMAALQQVMLLPAGQFLPELLGAELYGAVLAIATKHGLPEAVLLKLKPWAVFVNLSMPPPRSGMFMDLKLLRAARELDKSLHGLETLDQHLGALEQLPLEDQRKLLQQMVGEYGGMAAVIEQMHQAYLQQDLQRIQQINDDMLTHGDQRLAKKLMQQMVFDRNVRMAASMQELFARQVSFVAIGALHLPGKQGVLHLLHRRGFVLEPVRLASKMEKP